MNNVKEENVKRAISALKEGGQHQEVVDALEGLLSGDARAVLDIVDLNSFVACTLWAKEDLESALEDAGVDPTEENVETLLEEVEEDLFDCSQGWFLIESAVKRIFDTGFIQVSVRDMEAARAALEAAKVPFGQVEPD